MPYVTDTELAASLASRLTLGSADALPAHWLEVVPRANLAGYRALRAVLLNRGYTAAQVAAWEDNATWNTTLALNRAEWFAAGPADRPPIDQEWKDLLEELAGLVLVIADEAVLPDAAGGRVGYGGYDTAGDRFTEDDVL